MTGSITPGKIHSLAAKKILTKQGQILLSADEK